MCFCWCWCDCCWDRWLNKCITMERIITWIVCSCYRIACLCPFEAANIARLICTMLLNNQIRFHNHSTLNIDPFENVKYCRSKVYVYINMPTTNEFCIQLRSLKLDSFRCNLSTVVWNAIECVCYPLHTSNARFFPVHADCLSTFNRLSHHITSISTQIERCSVFMNEL